MEIRFISALTPADEDRIAPALLQAVAAFLDRVDFAYTLRIETSASQVLQHSHPSVRSTSQAAPAPAR